MSVVDNQVILVLLESEEQYTSLLESHSNPLDQKYIICALTMSAVTFCKENDFEYVLPDDFFTDKELTSYNAKSQRKIRDLIKSLNTYYHSSIKTDDDFLFDMGNYHFFILNHFFSALHYRAFFLNKMITGVKADKIIVFKSKDTKLDERPFPVSQYINCYCDLLKNSIFSEKVIYILTENNNNSRKADSLYLSLRSIASKLLRSVPIINSYLNVIRIGIKINYFEKIFMRVKSDILLVGMSGPWKYFFSKSLKKNRLSFYSGYIDENPSKLKARNWFDEWFSWSDEFCGFDIAALGYFEMDRVRVLSSKIIKMHKKHVNLIKKKKLLIYSVCPSAFQQYTLSLGKYFNKPRICYQHGAMSMTSMPMNLCDESSELLYVSHYFSYGDQVSIHKEKDVSKIEGFKKAISIGSIALENFRDKKMGKNSYILYCSSKYLSNSGGFLPRYLDINVYNNQKNLINYFSLMIKENPSLKVVWKLNQELSSEQPNINLSENIKIISDELTFTDLHTNAKMVILDRPSTTSLEACMTDKPIFILLQKNYFYPATESMLKKRAVVKHSTADLLQAIIDYISKDIYPADINNREFLEAYGIFKDDGNTITRVDDSINNIMNTT